MTHLVKQNSCRLILFSYSTTMPWWPPQVLIVGLCTLCFFVWPLEVCGGRQPSLPGMLVDQVKILLDIHLRLLLLVY